MLVIFRNKAFIDGKLYKASSAPQEVADGTVLPKSARALTDKELAAYKGPIPESMRKLPRQVALSELARAATEKPAISGVPGDQRTSGGLDENLSPQSDNTHGMSKEDPSKPAVEDPKTLSEMNKLLSKDVPDDDDDEAPAKKEAPKGKK